MCTFRNSEKLVSRRDFSSDVGTIALLKWIHAQTVKCNQLQRVGNLMSQGGTFLQFLTLTSTPGNSFSCEYGSEREFGRCQIEKFTKTGGSIIFEEF